MGKRNHHHSVHFSDEIQALIEERMKARGIASLNRYVEALIEEDAAKSRKPARKR